MPPERYAPTGTSLDELASDRLAEEPVELLDVLVVATAAVGLGEVEVPVAAGSRPPRVGRQRARVARPQQLHAGEQRAVGEDVLEGEVLEQCAGLTARCSAVCCEQRLDLRAEQQHRPGLGVVERLDPVAVAGEEQLARARDPRSRTRTCR